MKAFFVSLVAIALLGLGACTSQVPVVKSYPLTHQQKMQAAHHWDVLATDVAQRLAVALSTQDPAGGRQILNVQGAQCCSVFNYAFHNLLITRLLEQGFGVSDDPKVGLPVKYEVQVVTHKERYVSAPDNEVIVTTSVMVGDRYSVRISDVYYISDNNPDQYLVLATPATRLMEVVGQ